MTAELEETRGNWQTNSEADNEEISSLQAKVAELNAKVEKLESKEKEIEFVNQKCRKCNIVVKGEKITTNSYEGSPWHQAG